MQAANMPLISLDVYLVSSYQLNDAINAISARAAVTYAAYLKILDSILFSSITFQTEGLARKRMLPTNIFPLSIYPL